MVESISLAEGYAKVYDVLIKGTKEYDTDTIAIGAAGFTIQRFCDIMVKLIKTPRKRI